MSMRFYEVASNAIYENDGVEYFRTKAEAVTFAIGLEVHATVSRVAIKDAGKTTIIALANGRNWCSEREVVFETNTQ